MRHPHEHVKQAIAYMSLVFRTGLGQRPKLVDLPIFTIIKALRQDEVTQGDKGGQDHTQGYSNIWKSDKGRGLGRDVEENQELKARNCAMCWSVTREGREITARLLFICDLVKEQSQRHGAKRSQNKFKFDLGHEEVRA